MKQKKYKIKVKSNFKRNFIHQSYSLYIQKKENNIEIYIEIV